MILPYCRYVADPIRLEVREGHVTRIEGGLDAKLMRDWLEDGGRARATATRTRSRTSAGA